MKVIWEEKDIIVGTLYLRAGSHQKEVWMIGYDATATGLCRYVSVSMNDGMVTSARTKDDFCNMLNEAEYIPVAMAESLGFELPEGSRAFILAKMPT